MSAEIIHIKNMVCRRCVMAVEDICHELDISGAKVSLGSVTFSDLPDHATIQIFHDRLRAIGFEPLQSHELVVLEKIKATARYYARHYTGEAKEKLSAYIEKNTGLDFRYASRMFSSLERRTLQNYLMMQRIEYVKELLFNNELTLAEIADETGFSSVAHLSSAFKKTQGITISQFRNNGARVAIDEI